MGKVRTPASDSQAKGFQPDSNDQPSPLESLSPLLKGECGASLERILRVHKPSALGDKCDRKKSTIYRWAADPADVPLAAIGAMAALDPDDEFLVRVAGHLLAVAASRALARDAQRRAQNVFHEIAPGRWAR